MNRRLAEFGTTIFSAMTQLAQKHDAINLAQGFPDFEGPEELRRAAEEALRSGENQYARSAGHPPLVEALASWIERRTGLSYDPMHELTVTCGATEGIAAALLGLLEPGDEVILFEPFYDSYLGGVALAGATPRLLPLRFDDGFALDEDELERLVTPRTRLVMLNTPHNPTGKVFRREELAAIARLCQRHDLRVLSDEVYEFLTFDDAEHVSIATLPGMRERTVTLSSSGKTFSFTGWKVGWASGPRPLIEAVQRAHQFLTFCAPRPFQAALAAVLPELPDRYFEEFRAHYADRRSVLLDALRDAGFAPHPPAGTYFVLARFPRADEHDDHSMARHMTETIGVTPLPPSSFYRRDPGEGRRLLRFAFCKRKATLEEAARNLRGHRF